MTPALPKSQLQRFDRVGMLPYNKEFGPTRISSADTKVTKPAMANHLSALKRARQTERRTVRNRANTSTLRTQLRALRETIEKGDKAAAEQAYRQTVSALDKAIQKGTLHENTASRYKSRLGVRVNAMK
jgi:small subunit ribosomal protein S20